MNIDEFRKNAHETVDWVADYFQSIEKYPVKSQVNPGDVFKQLPEKAPEGSEPYSKIINDLDEIIMPGITHWQSPSFFAYFNANNSYPSVLAEMITSAIGAQCMSWQTSPAATELEEMMMKWVANLINLPDGFTGVIQDTASTATLCSILTAREKYSGFNVNDKGISNNMKFRVYCSSEAHSSIDKAVRISGIGSENLIKVGVDDNFALRSEELEELIKKDIKNGFKPLTVIAALGTTGSTAVDPLNEIGKICKKYDIWYHIDAAYAGTALMLPENNYLIEGIGYADTFVFNPHKWMFTNFDCSAYYVKDQEALINTFSILPEYLRTAEGDRVNNYRDWGIALGRRFRALKLWFVLRSFGTDELKNKVSSHTLWAKELGSTINSEENFETLAPVPFATICFRFLPPGIDNIEEINRINNSLMEKLNGTGKLYLTHTKLNEMFTLRFVIGQTYQEKKHIDSAWELIKDTARNYSQ
ncbi:MAG: aspartate aminotransferase family protein [Candidatus Aminicenantes bacterium]|nr:aspartate aminotransferase family protein [Candidatus Aminicenantes bacterium]